MTSILKYGLNPSGSQLKSGETITPPFNHFQLNQTYFKIDNYNWGSAIFCSPDILYACHPCYSEHIIIGGSQWCVILKVYIRPKSYQVFNSTVHKDYIDGEPAESEYRIQGDTLDSIVTIALEKSCIADCEAARKVVVQSVKLISKTFIDETSTTHGLSYEQIHKRFINKLTRTCPAVFFFPFSCLTGVFALLPWLPILMSCGVFVSIC